MEIIHKPLSQLTDNEYRACRNATLGDGGYMWYDIHYSRRRDDSHAIMLRGGYLYGWALLIPVNVPQEMYVTKHGKRVSKYTAQFFVRERMRGRGYGQILMNEVIDKYDPRPFVIPHDDKSGALFSKFRVSSEKEYRKYLKKAS